MLNEDIETVEQMRFVADELRDIANRKRILVNVLNKYASRLEYSQSDYDTSVSFDNFCQEISVTADVSYEGHRPGSEYTFWIPSSARC